MNIHALYSDIVKYGIITTHSHEHPQSLAEELLVRSWQFDCFNGPLTVVPSTLNLYTLALTGRIISMWQDYTRDKTVSLYMGKDENPADPMEPILETATTPTSIFQKLSDGGWYLSFYY